MAEIKVARDLENQILYSVDIGERDSSFASEDFAYSTGSKQEKYKSDKLVCGFKELSMVQFIGWIDVLTIVRMPAVLI